MLGMSKKDSDMRPIQVIVYAQDATSFKRSEAQIANSLQRAISSGQRFL